MKDTQTPGRGTTTGSSQVWTDEEKAAMVEHAKEQKKATKRGAEPDGEADVLAKIAEMPEADRAIAERIHAIVKRQAPSLAPRTYYGMPAYSRDGRVIVFFQAAAKFKSRYSTIGFNDGATLDDGTMWPTSYALTKLTAADEAMIAALVKKAAG